MQTVPLLAFCFALSIAACGPMTAAGRDVKVTSQEGKSRHCRSLGMVHGAGTGTAVMAGATAGWAIAERDAKEKTVRRQHVVCGEQISRSIAVNRGFFKLNAGEGMGGNITLIHPKWLGTTLAGAL